MLLCDFKLPLYTKPDQKFSRSKQCLQGSGCGSVGRAVAFDTRGPRFDSSHRQNFIEHLFIINCIEKMKINKKRPGMAHFFFKKKQHLYHNLRSQRLIGNFCSFWQYLLYKKLTDFIMKCLNVLDFQTKSTLSCGFKWLSYSITKMKKGKKSLIISCLLYSDTCVPYANSFLL